MKLYDTASQCYSELKANKLVKIYVCGITPYDSAHLGHIFTFMTYDLLQRRLESLGHKVQMVRNITDVDEPIYSRAAELKIPYEELAKKEIASFHSVMDKLNFRPLYAEPLASQYIKEMALAVKELLNNKFAYYIDKDVYFDNSKYPEFANFSGFSHSLQMGLSAMRGGDPDRAGKRQPLDFLLWKSIDDPLDHVHWDSPVGEGRPGWHIECSVMAANILGTPFDIHGGGADLIFPHHSAEIAQNYGLGAPLTAKLWIHVYPLFSDGEKMSKSLGNLVFANDLLKKHEPAVVRLALMHYHHRIGGEWQPELLREARELLNKIHEMSQLADKRCAEQLLERIGMALDDDINTLEVIDAFHAFALSCSKVTPKNAGAGKELVLEALDLVGLS